MCLSPKNCIAQKGLGSKPGVLFRELVARMKYPRACPMAPLHSQRQLSDAMMIESLQQNDATCYPHNGALN